MPAGSCSLHAAPSFTGEFETHLTVSAGSTEKIDRLAAFAVGRSVKFTHIVLDGGSTPLQPMLTLPGRGTLASQIEATRELARDLASGGFDVVRVKVEAAPWNDGVPSDDAAAPLLDSSLYFEHHVKLVLGPADSRGELSAVIAPFGARLSRNARRRRDDGKAEWFATQRCYRVGRSSSGARLAALLGALEHAGYQPVEVEREFVVHDDAPSVDRGWLDSIKEAQ